MLSGTYDAVLEWKEDAELPPYKGSMIRGAFGYALKGVVCALKKNHCGTCAVRSRCLYARIFEEATWERSPALRMSAPPHPVLFLPETKGRTFYEKGATMGFSIRVFGEMNRELPVLVHALSRMERYGLGASVHGRRRRFFLKKVTCAAEIIWEASRPEIRMPSSLSSLALLGPPENRQRPSAVRVSFTTPLRIKYTGAFPTTLLFADLIRLALRRIASVFVTFAGGEPDLPYAALIERAKKVRIGKQDLCWQDWQRWSNRQKRRMFMGGFMGEIVYEGDLAPFFPLLEMVQSLHLGKNTAFGLGQIRLDWVTDPAVYKGS